MERLYSKEVINMVYELLFLGFVKMFPQELGKCLISQRVSITLFVLQFKDCFRVFKAPHPWDRRLCQALQMPNLESDVFFFFFELLFRLPHLDGLGVHSCRKQKPHSNNTEMEPSYAANLFFFFLKFTHFFPFIYFF